MIKDRIPERVAMMISRHKTRSVLERYKIVSEADLREAAWRIEEHNRERMVTVSVTVDALKQGRGAIRN